MQHKDPTRNNSWITWYTIVMLDCHVMHNCYVRFGHMVHNCYVRLSPDTQLLCEIWGTWEAWPDWPRPVTWYTIIMGDLSPDTQLLWEICGNMRNSAWLVQACHMIHNYYGRFEQTRNTHFWLVEKTCYSV